ncbi:MAG: hypothetical protein GYA87_10055, partial [Christensenellaceae bacterium]|nr:hypothetical protein [Christensenellaceae bacterium]
IVFVIVFSIIPITFTEEITTNTQYTAVNIKTLKVRNAMDLNARGIGSIPVGTTVQILKVEKDWFFVKYMTVEGYVQSQFFKDFAVDISSSTPASDAETFDTPTQIIEVEAFDDNIEFVANYVAKPNRSTPIYEKPDERTKKIAYIPKYAQIEIAQIKGQWAYIKYENNIGYILNEDLVQYDALNPYADLFPGIIKYKYAAVIAKDTPLIDQENPNNIHRTIPAGAVIGVQEADKNGMMHVRYMSSRHGLISEEDTISLVEAVPYDKAEPGDLISVFTTFFPVHNSNILIVGRVYNMYLSSEMLNGKIIDVGETISMNDEIGPYRSETGYKKAPIASKTVDYGYGGGTCQMNTTTYNTLIQIPILIKHRRVHSRSGAVYAPVGFDAATGSLASVNMIFENTLPYPIMMQYYVSENVLTCLIYRAK